MLGAASADALAGTNGTWTDTTSGGLWSDPSNWSGGVVADGTDGIADFSTLDLTADNTVHLDSSRTIGSLLFGDTTPSNNWTLHNNGNAANILTMGVSSGSPLIQVNNQSATISAILAGAQGLTTAGSGTVTLSGANTYSGGTTVANGTAINTANSLILGSSTTQNGGAITSGPVGTGAVTLGSIGAGSSSLFLGTAPGLTVANPIVANDSSAGSLILGSKNASGVNTFAGNITLGATNNVGKSIYINAPPVGELDLTGNILANGADSTAGLVVNSGTVRLTGNSTYVGGTTVNTAVLILDPAAPANSVLGSGTIKIRYAPDTLQLRSGSAISSNRLDVFDSDLTINLSGIINAADLASYYMRTSFLFTTGPSASPNSPYSLSLGTGPGSTVFLDDSSTLHIAKNGTGVGTLFLGSLVSPIGFGVESGVLTLNYPATNISSGAEVDIGQIGQSSTLTATVNSNNATALGTGTVINLNNSGATFNVGVSQQIMSLENAALPPNFAPATIVNLNPAGTPSQLTIGTGSADKSPSTFSGNIVGADGSIVVNKGPNCTVRLAGTDTYSGGTIVNGGRLVFAGAASIPSGSITINNGAEVGDGAAINQAFLNHFTSSSNGIVGFDANSSNNLDLSQASGANLPNVMLGATNDHFIVYTYSGPLTPYGKTYQFGGGGFGMLAVNSVLKDSPAGSTSLTLSGNLTLVLSGTNTYSGDTTVNGGTLQVTGSLDKNGPATTFVSAGTDFTLASLIRRVQPGGSYAGLGATAGGIAIGSMADIRAGKN
ncbi:MAG TPA: autotransporter-associated beta strand repeat-containing protein, partial [Pirellulales bacterium]|nr:autotransporter-associated beta strand repeat-containing protein [Pirellulales bacterium]